MRWSVFGAMSGLIAVVLGFGGIVVGLVDGNLDAALSCLVIAFVGVATFHISMMCVHIADKRAADHVEKEMIENEPPVTSDDVGFLPFHPLEKGLDREAFIKEQMIRRLKQPSPYSGDDKGRRS